MPDISQYLKQAEELDKKKGITPAQTARSGPDLTQYLKQAEALDSARATAQKTTNTTRAVGAGVGGRVPEIQLPRLDINAFGAGSYGAPKVADTAKRIGKTVAAAGTGAAGNYAEALGQITTPQGLTIGESARVALQGGTRAQERAAEQAKAQRIQENIKDPLQAYSDKMAKKSAALTEEAKAGLGKVGQFAVDLGVTGTQLLGDVALGLVNPALGTAAMGTRVFGGSAQEARQSGATETQQQLYGLASAAVSVGVEKLAQVGGLFKKAYGGSIAGGSVDDILNKLTGKLIKNPVGQRMLASAAGEAGEEALEALVQPALQAIYDKGASLNETWFGDKEQLTEYLAEVGYNALLGGALGALGAGGNILAPTAPQTAQDGATAAQTAADASVAGSETPAAQNGAERPQNAAQEARGGQTSPAWGRYMESGSLFGGGRVREGFTTMENAVANQFERDTGISIEAVESILGGLANGEYDAANWVAKIARDAKDPKMVVMAHELTHHLQTLAPQEYESFRTAVADYFTRAGGETALADMMSRYRNAYGEAGQNLSDNAVMDEIAADFTQVLLEDADLFGRFVQENRTVAERLLDALKALIEKIRATFTGRSRDAAAQEATGRTLSELEQIAEQWQSVYDAASAAYGQNANTATQEGDGVRYSLGASNADTYSRIYDMQVEVNNLSKSIKELEDSADFKEQMDKLSKGIANDNVQDAIEEYRKWQESSGYDALYQRRDALKTELENLRKEWEKQLANEAVEKEKKAIAKSGLSEADYFRKQAVKEFGYTPYFYDAGYIIPNGKMLNFSGEKGKHFGSRGQDHRAIGTIYEDTSGTDALNRFMRDGNIRIMAESPGIDISTLVEPSKEQYATIRKFINEYANKGYFNVDLSDENGRVIGSLSYENRVNSTRIINDIKHYYATGEIREQSDAERFRYSLKDKRVPTYEELIAKPDMVVVDISTPKTQGTFAERRKKIKETVPEVIKKPYLNRDTGTMIFLTKKSYTHAFNNNKELDINAAEHFPELIENAIFTHAEQSTHGNENANGVYTFFAAARGKEDVPVKLKVKEIDVVGQEIPANVAAYFEENPKEYAEAYDSVVLEVLEIEESPNGSGKDVNQNGSFLTPTGLRTIKVADFLPLVNGDESKYVPKSGNMAQLKSTAPLRQMMRDIRMPQLTTVEQDMAAAEAAPVEDAPAVENEVQLPQLSDGLTDADAPTNEPLTRQDVAREMAWRDRMANEPAAPQPMQEIQLPQLSADIEEAGMGVADFTGNVEMTPEAASAEIDQAMEELYQSLDATMETPTDAAERDERQKISRVEGLVSAQTAAEDKTLREKAAESWSFFKRKMVDAGDTVTRIGKAVGDSYLYPFYNFARSSASAGANMIAGEQTDVNGKPVGQSLNAIFDPIRAQGEEYYTRFQTYMYDLHNIARMSMDERAKAAQEEAKAARAAFAADHPEFLNMTEAEVKKQTLSTDELKAEDAKEYLRLIRWVNRTNRMGNKAVFDWEWTAEDSRGRSERLLRENPEFAQYREQVREYIDNLMQYRVDSGLITQKDADFLREYYPDYVPTKRQKAKDHFAETGEKKKVKVGKTVGRARGGEEKLLPLHEALGKQTMQVVREGSKNRFGRRLLADYMETPNDPGVAKHITNAEEYDADFSIDSLDAEEDTTFKGNTFSVYSDGKLYEMTVDGAMLEAVKALSPDAAEQNSVVKAVRSINKVYKAMLTGYNPTFAIRNTVRDLQTAGLYSRDFSAWAKNYPKALQEIKRDGPMWKQYKALGGDFSSVFDYATGTVRKPTTKVGKMADRMQAINMAMEQAPRLAEFMSVMEKGDGSMETAMDAMLAAADVTVNFGRSGTWGKWLNANYVPFLNPGIQGFDKMVRYATQTRSGKQWLMMAVRAAALGIAPSLINALLYHDDEEWEELRDSDKDTNYMFKIRDGLWLKIPKGRELSVLGITADRVGDALRGEDVDLRGALNTMANQVAPANPLNQNILKAAYDTQLFDPSSPGRTWYGGDIESQRLQNYAPGQRYDSSTDIVSKAVGGALNLSPAKINYLLDQYSGVAGDIVLPLLTPQAERDMFSKAFTVDSISGNELSGKFYDAADELTYAKNGGDRTAEVVSRYWNRVSSEVSALYGEIRRVEESDLSNRQKKEQVGQLQSEINDLQRKALATKEQYTAAAEGNLFAQTDEAKDYAYRETNREVFGAEYALETYDKNVYAKAKEAVAGGASYEGYYDYYFSTQGDGTAEKLGYLQHSGLTDKEQSAIFYAAIASDSDTATQKETGLSKEQYYLYRAATYGIESDRDATGKTIPGSKKEKMLQAIDGLDLTVPQKDALYFANGYAKSTLYDAPWYNIVPRL